MKSLKTHPSTTGNEPLTSTVAFFPPTFDPLRRHLDDAGHPFLHILPEAEPRPLSKSHPPMDDETGFRRQKLTCLLDFLVKKKGCDCPKSLMSPGFCSLCVDFLNKALVYH